MVQIAFMNTAAAAAATTITTTTTNVSADSQSRHQAHRSRFGLFSEGRRRGHGRDDGNASTSDVPSVSRAHSSTLLPPIAARTLRNKDRAFYTFLVGEAADDYGGPYNEVMAELSSELMSPSLPLFTRCPNYYDNLGMNRDQWVPAPAAARSPLCLSMFEFLGKLMGIAIRTRNPLALQLPSIVWKPLVQVSYRRYLSSICYIVLQL